MSQHIDGQRHRLSELEREAYWIDLESESLKKQILQLGVTAERVRECEDKRSLIGSNISKMTDSIVSLCCGLIVGDTNVPDHQTLKSLVALPGMDEHMESLNTYGRSAVCASIVDAPAFNQSLNEHLDTYERGLNILLDRPSGSVRLVYAYGDQLEEGAMRVLFSLDCADQELLSRRVQLYLSGQEKPSDTSVQFVIRVTRSIIMDMGTVVNGFAQSFGAHNSGQQASHVPETLSLPPTNSMLNPHHPVLSSGVFQSLVRDTYVEKVDTSPFLYPPTFRRPQAPPSESGISTEPIPTKPWGRRASRSD